MIDFFHHVAMFSVCLSVLSASSVYCVRAADTTARIADDSLVFTENDGLVAAEAEHAVRQELSGVRAFHFITSRHAPMIEPHGGPAHIVGAAGGAYFDAQANPAIPEDAPVHTRPQNVGSVTVQEPRRTDGNGDVEIGGELAQWHKVTLTLDGPFADELDAEWNPFVDYAMNVTFTHESGSPKYVVPGYFAADGDAANSSAASGTKWRAHLSPDKPGRWTYSVSFARGPAAAFRVGGEKLQPFDGATGSFTVGASQRTGRDLRGKGLLQYVGKHYLRFAGTGEYFLKAGADAPETLLAYADFDGTVAHKPGQPLKTWSPHVRDWRAGDPTWKGGRGKGLVGAINYLSGKGMNVFSFLTYNAGGDGDNVWPFVERDDKLHYDCSKLDQWGIVFDHGTAQGMYLHFKLSESENSGARGGRNPVAMDNGELGVERKLYLREMIARYGHALALNWNLGEENTQTVEQQRDMAAYIASVDPYHHLIVTHTGGKWTAHQRVYPHMLGDQSALTGASLQTADVMTTHAFVLHWVTESARAGKPWVVANDEQDTGATGMPPDPGFGGYHQTVGPDIHATRKFALWGTLMAGGAGVEYYFGYKHPYDDLDCEDWRSRDQSWDYCRHALDFFHGNAVLFWEMSNADELVGNPEHDNSRYCLAKPGEIYLVYLPEGGTCDLNLGEACGAFGVQWFNPRIGGFLTPNPAAKVDAGGNVRLGPPPADPDDDWLVVVRK